MKWFSSLRFRILFLVFMTFVPIFMVLFYTSNEQRRRSIAESGKDSLQNVRLLSGLIGQKVEGARSLLTALSHNPVIQNRDSASCNKTLAKILEHSPQYANLGAADPDGNVFCSATPMTKPVNASDKAWFQRTVKSRDIAVGDYQIGRIMGKHVIIMGYAARDESGRVQAVIFVPFDLTKLSKLPEQVNLSHDTVFLLLDRNGTILSRSPGHGKWVGKTVSKSPLIKTIISRQEGIADIEGIDGIKRMYSFTPVPGTDNSIFASIGIPKDIALADINKQFIRNLMLLGLIAVLSVAAALIMSRLARQSEETLQESERKYRELVENANSIILRWNRDGIITFMNEFGQQFFGYSKGEILGRHVVGAIVPETESTGRSLGPLMDRICANPKDFEQNINENVRRNGERIWISWTNKTVLDRQGQMLEVLSVGSDITEHKKAAEALQKSEERLRLSTELANVAVWEYSFITNSMSRSNNHDQLYGLEWQTKWDINTFLNATHPDDREYSNEMIQKSVAPGGPDQYTFDFRVVHPDQSIHCLMVVGQVTERNAEGQGTIVRGCLIDITERRRAEDKLRQSEELFSKAFLASPSGMTITRIADGKFINANESFLSMFEFSHEETIGHTSTELKMWSPEEREKLIAQQLASGGLRNFELSARSKSGRFINLLFSSKQVEVDGEACYITTFVNITERKWAEEELRKYRDHLEVLVKERTKELEDAQEALASIVEDLNEKSVQLAKAMEQAQSADRMKSAFLATMSHELRTPLNSIIGFTGIALQEMSGPLNDEQAKQLSMVKDSANHLLSLINDVLDISKIEAGQIEIVMQSFDMRSVIEAALRTVLPQAEKKGLTLDSAIASDVGLIISDQRRVAQILINLVGNAVKFTEQGNIRIECRINEGRLETCVRDTGIGIKPEDIDMIFKPFGQVETGLARNHEGTGLGLSICEKLVEMLGGSIRAESKGEKGSAFTFTLPV